MLTSIGGSLGIFIPVPVLNLIVITPDEPGLYDFLFVFTESPGMVCANEFQILNINIIANIKILLMRVLFIFLI